jgi:hypothetical protein
MKNTFFGGVAIATALIIQSGPASAQHFCGAGPCVGHPQLGHGPVRTPVPTRPQFPPQAQFQHEHSHWPGHAIAAGAGALTAGAIVGGAIAAERQDYYPSGPYPADPAYEYADVGYRDHRLCAKLRWTCEHKDELGLQGAGTCRRYREACD